MRWSGWGKRIGLTLGLVFVFLGLTFSSLVNGFGVAPINWIDWEKASEAMVLERIEFDLLSRNTSSFGLSAWEMNDFDVYDRLGVESVDELEEIAPTTFDPYLSEVGGQAYFWSFLWRKAGCSSTSCLHAVSSALFAAVAIGMFLAFRLIASSGLAWAWLVSTAASPWFVYSARNLFWSPWLYFIPALAAVGLVLCRTRKARGIALAGVWLAFVVKYLATGYHEFTAVTMMAAAMPFLVVIFRKIRAGGYRVQLENALAIFLASGAAMFSVLVLHAYMLAGNVGEGLREIWVKTVLRRTYGDATAFPGYSLDASPVDVVWRYVYSAWSTDLLHFSVPGSGSIFSVSLGSSSFLVLLVLSLFIIGARAWIRDWRWKRDGALIFVGFMIAAFWFVSAKGYSFIHVHILFFLWYFLLVPALLFVNVGYLWEKILSAMGDRSVEQSRVLRTVRSNDTR